MTGEEIIQALRCCEREKCGDSSSQCPLYSDSDCITHLSGPTADLIEKLTAENADLRKELAWKDAERDAELADLADVRSCKTCKYACDTRDCSSCKSKTCKCRECHLDKNAWEWRGLPEAPEGGTA